MNKRIILPLVLLLAGFALAGSYTVLAQFSPPTTSPPANNVSQPVNIGSKFQEKSSNLFVRLSGTNVQNYLDTTWNPIINTNSNTPSPFAFDTNAWARAWGVQTRNISVGSPWASGQTATPAGALHIPYASDPNTISGVTAPAQKPLCVKKIDGLLVPCPTSPSVSLTANPVFVSTFNGSTTLSWDAQNATFCEPVYGHNFAVDGVSNATTGSRVINLGNTTRRFVINCYNDVTGETATDSIRVDYAGTAPAEISLWFADPTPLYMSTAEPGTVLYHVNNATSCTQSIVKTSGLGSGHFPFTFSPNIPPATGANPKSITITAGSTDVHPAYYSYSITCSKSGVPSVTISKVVGFLN